MSKRKTQNPRKQGSRPLRSKSPPFRRKKYLIICEGERTEPNYFKSKIASLPKLQPGDCELVGTGKNTDSLVAEAVATRIQFQAKGVSFDEVWAVFDRDSFPAQNVNNAHLIAEAEGIKCAFSNEAFELWFLLHFNFHDTCTSRNDYSRRLTPHLKRPYAKNDPEIFDLLVQFGNEVNAIKYAIRLEENCEGKTPAQCCPRTTVFSLIQSLNVYQ